MNSHVKVGSLAFGDIAAALADPEFLAGPVERRQRDGESWPDYEVRLWGTVARQIEERLPRVRVLCEDYACDRRATGVCVRYWPTPEVPEKVGPVWAEARCHRHAFGYVIPFEDLEADALSWLMHIELSRPDGAVDALVEFLTKRRAA